MLLRNYDNVMVARQLPQTTVNTTVSTDTTLFEDSQLNVKTVSNSLQPIYFNSYHNCLPLELFEGKTTLADCGNTYQRAKSMLIIGEGDTDVTYDDYTLAKPFTNSQHLFVSHSITPTEFNVDKNCWEKTYKKVFIATEDLTIKEIGVASSIPSSNIESSGAYCLMYREVLQTPIEVLANANVVITFKMKFSANPNKPVEIETDVSVFEFTELSEYKVECGGQSGYTEYLTLVSDTILTEEQLKNASMLYIDEDGVESTLTFESEDCEFINMDNQLLGIFGSGGERPLVVSIPNDNTNIADSLLFSKAGTYIAVFVDTENNNEFMFGVKKMTLAANAN